jgi:putative nucleotidyltransferase with HDIG domain
MQPDKINFKNISVQAGIISKIINLDVEANDCFRELDDLIGSDQGVASLVLRVVNSPLYSRGNQVATIPLAISLLGYSVVRSLALLAFGRSLFSQTRNALFRLHIWQHSLLTAIASQAICRILGAAKLDDEAFIAGLMHDTGKVLMFTHKPELYERVFQHAQTNHCTSLQAEQEFFGFDHCQVGLEAVREWKLPQRFNGYMGSELAISRAGTQHVGPGDAEPRVDTLLLSLMAANYLVKAAGIGAEAISDYDTKNAALLALGLSQTVREQLLEQRFIESLMENETYKLCASI